MGVFEKFKGLFASSKKSGTARTEIRERFELLGRTGQGSMSRVFRARDKKLKTIVCLKLLNKEKTAKFEARFAGLNRPTEGAICLSLKHKNIVETLEHGITTEGEPFLVFELIKGGGLNYLIETKSNQLSGKRIDFLVQIADGLEYVHEQRFLHRDICPRNIMVTDEGVVKIIDFGLTIPYKPEFCRPGNRTGTPSYLAPELIKRVVTDHRVDLFALGISAYEIFTGALPWERAQSFQTVLNHLNTQPMDPREYCPDLDEASVDFLLKAIDIEPRRRFQTAAEFREALLGLPKR